MSGHRRGRGRGRRRSRGRPDGTTKLFIRIPPRIRVGEDRKPIVVELSSIRSNTRRFAGLTQGQLELGLAEIVCQNGSGLVPVLQLGRIGRRHAKRALRATGSDAIAALL